MNSLDDWLSWRREHDRLNREQDERLAEHDVEIEVLKTKQQIAVDNEAARHAKTPQLVISLVSVGLSILFFILQLFIAKGGAP